MIVEPISGSRNEKEFAMRFSPRKGGVKYRGKTRRYGVIGQRLFLALYLPSATI